MQIDYVHFKKITNVCIELTKNTNGDFLLESLIYLNLHMKFHFLVDWLALTSLYRSEERRVGKEC